MDFNKEEIQNQLRPFWLKNWKKFTYKLNGKEVEPTAVSGLTAQLEEGEFGDGYNFRCTALHLRVAIEPVEKAYKAEFIMKVEPAKEEGQIKPGEKIIGIKDNTVWLKD